MDIKVACVTGASRGIGAAISLRLARDGYLVIGLARGVEHVNELSWLLESCCLGEIVGRECDLEIESNIHEAFAWIKNTYGRLDVFINNAGVMITKFLIDEESASFRKMFDVNVIASCICLKAAVRLIEATTGRGQIVVINSVLGHRVPDIPFPMKPSFGVYPATKHALTGLCQTLRQELSYSKLPIKITSISPGMVESDMLSQMDQQLIAMLPKLEVEDVAEAVHYVINTPDRVRVDEIILNPMLC